MIYLKKMKIYTPLFIDGQYVDNVELYERGKPGEAYMCECRQKHDAFTTRSAFMAHIKLKCHQSWLESLDHPDISLNDNNQTLVNPLISLKDEQDSEYERALKEDQKKTKDKHDEEMRIILQKSEEEYKKELEIRDKADRMIRKRNIVKKNEPGYNFRFVFPNGKRVNFSICPEYVIGYMRNYIDVYTEDNSIDIVNYELVTYPNKILDECCLIKDILENKSTIYIRNLEN